MQYVRVVSVRPSSRIVGAGRWCSMCVVVHAYFRGVAGRVRACVLCVCAQRVEGGEREAFARDENCPTGGGVGMSFPHE